MPVTCTLIYITIRILIKMFYLVPKIALDLFCISIGLLSTLPASIIKDKLNLEIYLKSVKNKQLLVKYYIIKIFSKGRKIYMATFSRSLTPLEKSDEIYTHFSAVQTAKCTVHTNSKFQI